MSEATRGIHKLIAFRLAGTTLAASVFLLVCWLMAGSVHGDTRLLAGPVGLLRTQSLTDLAMGSIPTGVLSVCIFVVGVWRNPGTVTLSIIGGLAWIAVGIWIEGTASG